MEGRIKDKNVAHDLALFEESCRTKSVEELKVMLEKARSLEIHSIKEDIGHKIDIINGVLALKTKDRVADPDLAQDMAKVSNYGRSKAAFIRQSGGDSFEARLHDILSNANEDSMKFKIECSAKSTEELGGLLFGLQSHLSGASSEGEQTKIMGMIEDIQEILSERRGVN
ncbi:MAG: hypothetical protein WC783_03980 [Candidatus Paceibacterota bacterium]|jgi:hypothetical protein